jgi:ABC-type multidrug transport system ATPase subunit
LRACPADERARLLRLVAPRQTVIIASRYPSAEAGLVNRVVFLRDGRVALNASVSDLPQAGAGLSMTALETLAGTTRAA